VWDPDDTTTMARWVPVTKAGTRSNRAALAVTPRTQPSCMTELPGEALNQIGLREIGRRRGAFGDPMTQAVLDKGDIQPFYGQGRGWAGVAWGFYGPILMHLESAFLDGPYECPVYAFGYDWRRANQDSATDFERFVGTTLDKHPGAEQCIVVTHSMGGFVVRAALAGLASKIRGVVHTVHPSLGAVACYTRFFSGVSNPAEDIGVLDAKSRVLARILGRTPEEYAYNMSGLPGPLQLLPNHEYQRYYGQSGAKWLDGLGNADLGDIYAIYSELAAPGGLVSAVIAAEVECETAEANQRWGNFRHGGASSPSRPLNQFGQHLTTAAQFHRDLSGATGAGYHANTVVMYSGGVSTMYSVRMGASRGSTSSDGGPEIVDQDQHIGYSRRPRGDGTVPDVSAMCPGAGVAADHPVDGLEHSAVFANAKFNELVVGQVGRMLQGP